VGVDQSLEPSVPDPTDAFETWLPHCVTRAAETGEVSAERFTELQADIAEAQGQLPNERHGLAIQEFAERFGLSMDTLPTHEGERRPVSQSYLE
jgi:hypothetical protein